MLKKLQKGRSMIEIIGVLGIMAMITALSIQGYKAVTKSRELQTYKTELVFLETSIKELYSNGDFSRVDDKKLQDLGFLNDLKSLPGVSFVEKLTILPAIRVGSTYTNCTTNCPNFSIEVSFLNPNDCGAATVYDIKPLFTKENCKNNSIIYYY